MADARLSRQQVEVIGQLATNLRVGGQSLLVAGVAQQGQLRVQGLSVEYLVPAAVPALESVIDIQQSVSTNQHMEWADNTIGIQHDVEVTHVVGSGAQILRTVITDLGASLDQSVSLVKAKTSDSDIGISHGASVVISRSLSVNQPLDIEGTAFAPSNPFGTSNIELQQSAVSQRVISRSLTSTTGISDSKIRTGTTRAGAFSGLSGWIWIWDPLFLIWQQDYVQLISTAGVEQIIGERPIYLSAGNTLTLVQSVSTSNIFNRQGASTLAIGSTSGYIFIQDTTFCDYAPMVGRTTLTDLPTPPPVTPPTLEPQLYDGIQLSYPVITPTQVVYLRGPELSNVDRFATQRINRESRGGSLMVSRQAYWPKVKQMSFTFTGLTEVEGQEVLNFVETSVGKEVKLRDWEGREWLGVIISTNEPIVRDRDDCFLTTNLEFELTDGT